MSKPTHRIKVRTLLNLREAADNQLTILDHQPEVPSRIRDVQTLALDAEANAADEMLFAFVSGGDDRSDRAEAS